MNAVVMRPTGHLRLVASSRDDVSPPVLQVWWVDVSQEYWFNVFDQEPKDGAHWGEWRDVPIVMEERMVPCNYAEIGGRALVESGSGLDAIGSLDEMCLPRQPAEADRDYRNRLLNRIRAVLELADKVET